MQTLGGEADTLFRQALDLHRTGRWAPAESIYREVLSLSPDQPDVLHALGVLRNQMGQPAEGVDLIRRAIALEPRRFVFHNSLGNALRAQGDLRAAAASFETALSFNPRSVEVYTNLGALMEEAGNFEDSTLCYLRALELNPTYADAHYALANLLKKLGNFDEAVRHYEQVVSPGCEYAPEALNNLGTTLRLLGRPAEAIERFRQAIALRAPYFEAHINLADALEEAGRLEEAAHMYQAILSFRPDSAIAYSGAAGVLQDQGRPERATAAYRKAVELAPENAVLHSNLLLHLHYDPSPTPTEILAAHREWGERHAPPALRDIPPAGPRDPDRPLRIGFVSADLRCHPVGFFLAPLLVSRLRQGCQFICYSDAAAPDAMTHRLARGADLWRTTWSLDDPALAALIRQDGIDILVDLAGHTRGNRLLVCAQKPAPVQVAWMGYPDTTGLRQMDHLLTDRWQTPAGSEQWFVEKPVHLPDGYVCYMPPDDAPRVAALPAATSGQVNFGSANRLAKINPAVVRLWAQLLREISGARLLLRAPALDDASVSRRYRKMFQNEGVDPSRLDLRGRCSQAELLASYSEIDIALDPFPYSGGLTTCEALWMGVPVVSMPGERLASRHSASHLHNLGLSDLVCASPEDFLARAKLLALDPDGLAGLRATLRDRMASSPLVNGERFTANLLDVFRNIWRSYCR